MARLKLVIAYHGGPFSGWQSQADENAVQDHLEKAFIQLCGERIVVHGSGRTDAGVHAMGQVAHVDVPSDRFPLEKWNSALNACLPREIRILKLTRVASTFHARFDARGKIYLYRIWNDPIFHPLEIGRAWHFPSPIDFKILRECAAKLEGQHDFGGFAANRGKPGENTVRTLHEVAVRRKGPLITIRFRGNGFLYRMVRLLTGSLLRCAQARAEKEWIDQLLAAEGRIKSSFAAPADGLYLQRVLY